MEIREFSAGLLLCFTTPLSYSLGSTSGLAEIDVIALPRRLIINSNKFWNSGELVHGCFCTSMIFLLGCTMEFRVVCVFRPRVVPA